MPTRPFRSPWSAAARPSISLSRARRGQERRLRPERRGHAAAVSARPHRRAAKCSRERPPNRPACAPATPSQSVDGHAFHTVTTLLAYMQAGQGKPISLDGAAQRRHAATMVAHPAKLDAPAGSWALSPCPPPIRDDPLPLGEACEQVHRLLRRQLLPDCRGAAAASSRTRSRSRSSPARWALPAWPARRRR